MKVVSEWGTSITSSIREGGYGVHNLSYLGSFRPLPDTSTSSKILFSFQLYAFGTSQCSRILSFTIAPRNISRWIAVLFLEVGWWTKKTTSCQQALFQVNVLMKIPLFFIMTELDDRIPQQHRFDTSYSTRPILKAPRRKWNENESITYYTNFCKVFNYRQL